MRTNWETYPLQFAGGLITNLGLLEQGLQYPGSARALTNFETARSGGYRKILGYEKWVANAVPGETAFPIMASILASASTVITARKATYYVGERGDTTWASGLTVPNDFSHRIRHTTYDFGLGKTIALVDGINRPVYYDVLTGAFTSPTSGGTGEDVVGSSFVTSFADRLFFGKGPLLIYTNLLTGDDFDPALGAGVIKLESNITGLVVFRDRLIIFGEDRIDVLTGTSEQDFKVDAITRKTGCPWPDSIQEVGGDILYKGPDGIRYLSATEKNDDFALERASESVHREIVEKFVGTEDAVSFVVRNKGQYRLHYFNTSLAADGQEGFLGVRFADQTSQDIAWSVLRGFKVYTADSQQFGPEEVIVFSDGEFYLYQAEWGYSFDGAPISATFSTPFLFFEDPRVRKTWYKLHTFLLSQGVVEITLKATLDFDDHPYQPESWALSEGGGGSTYGTAIYGVSTYSAPSKISVSENLVGSGFNISFTYTDTSVNPSYTISSSVVEFAYNDRK